MRDTLIDDKTESECIIAAVISAIWSLERWHDVGDRLYAIRIALIYVAPSHPVIDDAGFLAGIASMRARA
ncbi:hypothetical protein [Thiocapsa roseopersicina]|uniref:Uncharacterized protein n=1 Tax=Thiocapsa roseopersicina TaxID=1058 RepID=A0A1H3DP81_THIRO|nr:hypothetical protein [Thiocapsa roseopersicina]SDX68332.1 hypothetical protein SAMN05421783_1552 [Thiocapsa roseopersicina]